MMVIKSTVLTLMMALIITKMDEKVIRGIRHLAVHDEEDINDDNVDFDGKGF